MCPIPGGGQVAKIAWKDDYNTDWNTRLGNRTYGRLKCKALEQAQKIVDENGDIHTSGEYGSIEID